MNEKDRKQRGDRLGLRCHQRCSGRRDRGRQSVQSDPQDHGRLFFPVFLYAGFCVFMRKIKFFLYFGQRFFPG